MNLTKPVNASAIVRIREARKAGHQLRFHPAAKDSALVASYRAAGDIFEIYASGVFARFKDDNNVDEDAGSEAALERRNDEWSRSDGSDGVWR